MIVFLYMKGCAKDELLIRQGHEDSLPWTSEDTKEKKDLKWLQKTVSWISIIRLQSGREVLTRKLMSLRNIMKWHTLQGLCRPCINLVIIKAVIIVISSMWQHRITLEYYGEFCHHFSTRNIFCPLHYKTSTIQV